MTVAIKRNADNIGMGDMLRPEIKLVQNTGGDAAKAAGAKPGQFYNTMTNEIYPDGFEFVVLDFSIQRVYWGRDVIGDEPPMCSSLDANSYESVNGDDCRKCEHLLDNAAMVQAKERREKCTKQFGFIGLLLPNLEPFMFRAPGTSSTAVMALLSRFKFNKACWNEEKTAIDFHRFKVAAFSQEQKTKAGSAWVIKFGEITPFNDANFEQELYLTSAQMLGQGNILISEQAVAEKTEANLSNSAKPAEAAVINPVKAEPVKAPKINVITPKTPVTQSGKSTASKIELDI
jgi:hypothetical protein